MNRQSHQLPHADFGPSELEEFKSELEANMRFIEENLSALEPNDQSFAESLCSYYGIYERLTEKQLPYALKMWRKIKNLRRGTGSEEY